ncbi:MAG: serine protease [Tabrizicola sp.]|jgi:hypothetical protein|nr:serine protease [Tabrizicola sp.]
MTEAGLTDLQASSLARRIRGNRLAVAAVHDRIAAQAGPDLDDFKTVALGISDPVKAYATALRQASTANPPWHMAFLSELATQGLIVDLQDALAEGSTLEAPMTLSLQDDTGMRVDLQAFNAAMTGTLGLAGLLGALNQAARRLCLIEVKTKPDTVTRGTGFLIGPHTVLTNWHVMDDVIDPATGQAIAGSDKLISISFESQSSSVGRICRVPEDWLLAYSPHPRSTDDLRPATVSHDGTQLDYCAIRVLGAPGRERGWYDMSQTGQLNHETDAFFVFQHPVMDQRVAFAKETKLDENNHDFLRHQVWTSDGSSGGLCLDQSLTPIAMHHAAVHRTAMVDGIERRVFDYNRAVRLNAIHRAKPDLGAGDLKYDKIAILSTTEGPSAVIGRAGTQATLRLMAAGLAPPILIIKGDRQSGKTFTADLLRASLPSNSFTEIKLSAAALPADPVDFARTILSQAGVSATVVDAALQGHGTLTTQAASVADIFKIVKRALLDVAAASRIRPFTHWLVIDQLKDVGMPGIGSRGLLDAMYRDEELRDVLRVLLIGLPDILTGTDSNLMREEKLEPPTVLKPKEIEECLAGIMFASGIVPASDEIGRHSAMVLGVSREFQKVEKDKTALKLTSEILANVYIEDVVKWKPR